jgi:uncharacterized surface protein with fasciclin (FAS1) repeats
MRRIQLIMAAIAALMSTAPAVASPNGNIVAVVSATPQFSTLEAAIKAARLTGTLASKGPFTVFAPTNDAFSKLPSGTVETLLKPENRAQLAKILTYHIVAGRYPASAILAAIQAGGGSTTLTTVEGGKLTASLQGGSVVLTDENGGTSTVTQTDIMQSNGIVHVIDTVVLPK